MNTFPCLFHSVEVVNPLPFCLSCIAGAKNNEKDRESADFDLLVKSLINFFRPLSCQCLTKCYKMTSSKGLNPKKMTLCKYSVCHRFGHSELE